MSLNPRATIAASAGGRTAGIALRALVAAALIGVASLFAASSAFAIYDHAELQAKFPSGCAEHVNPGVQDIAINEAQHRVYVYCVFSDAPGAPMYQLSYNGAPANWEASKPYIAGNQLIGNPGAPNGTFAAGFAGGHIAVDNSGGPNEGLIYILAGGSGVSGGSDNIQIFAPSGEFLGSIAVPQFAGDSKDIDVGPDGSLYFLTENRVSKYSVGYNEVARMYTAGAEVFSQGNRIVADNHGAVWTVNGSGPKKFEPDQLFTNYPAIARSRTGTVHRHAVAVRSLSAAQRRTRRWGPHRGRPERPQRPLCESGQQNRSVQRRKRLGALVSRARRRSGTAATSAGPGIAVTKDHLVFSSAPNAEVSRVRPGPDPSGCPHPPGRRRPDRP